MIYLDHAATSPISRLVMEAMWPYMTEAFANASSQHVMGKLAASGLDQARTLAADALGVPSSEIIFTSGGTESDNLAIKGLALGAPRGHHIVTTPIEHEAVLESCHFLERHHGFSVTYVDVKPDGRVSLSSLLQALRSDTTLCSVQYANSEIGTVQPIAEIAAICGELEVPLHVDAVQAGGLLPLDVNADLLSLSGHKFGGPKGTGLLRARRSHLLEPLIHGGGQERGIRSGTSNVAGAVGLAVALSLAEGRRLEITERLALLREQLIDGVLGAVPSAIVTGSRTQRLANHASFCFPGVSGEALLLELESEGIICSSGSACASGLDEPSYVLRAIGLDDVVARTAIRFTLGYETTGDEIAAVIKAVPEVYARIRVH